MINNNFENQIMELEYSIIDHKQNIKALKEKVKITYIICGLLVTVCFIAALLVMLKSTVNNAAADQSKIIDVKAILDNANLGTVTMHSEEQLINDNASMNAGIQANTVIIEAYTLKINNSEINISVFSTTAGANIAYGYAIGLIDAISQITTVFNSDASTITAISCIVVDNILISADSIEQAEFVAALFK